MPSAPLPGVVAACAAKEAAMIYPTHRYNLNFDVCALCLSVFLFALYIAKGRSLKERRVTLFLLLAACVGFSAGDELFTSLYRNGAMEMPHLTVTALTAATHLFHNSIAYILALYEIELLGISKGFSKIRYFLFSLPEIFLGVMILVPPLRSRFLFYYDDAGVYHGIHPGMYLVYYSVICVYALYCLSMLIRHRRVLTRREYILMLLIYAGFAASVIPAFISRYLRSTIFLQSLLVLGIYMVIENDAEAYDADTGLRSRFALWKETRGLFTAGYSSYVISVKVRDVDYYGINLGYRTMAALYRAVGTELRKLVTDKIHIYRTGTGSIAAALFNSYPEDAESFANLLMHRFEKAWMAGDTPVFLAVQVWISSIPDRIAKEEQLNAFIDSRYDENIPEGQLYYADEMKSAQRIAAVEIALKRALSADTLKVYYQPIYDTATGRVHSAEALSRMIDEELGFVSPEEFIHVAEQTGMIRELGEKVFEKVCAFLAQSDAVKLGLDFVEVNLSTVQCMDPDLADRFVAITRKYHVSPSAISLEITESSVVHDERKMAETISRLAAAGFTFALDDFGTGNANYTYVMKYPFSLIKIDKSFLWNAEKSGDAKAILLNMLELVKGIGRKAVVEGVETEAQRDFLIDQGVSYLQGYYYSKPVPQDQFLDFIGSFNAGPASADVS